VVIMVMGVSGSGKTTVGQLLAGKLGWPFYDADDFHPPANIEKMRQGTPLTEEERVPWLAALHNLPVRRVTVRNQRSRWGSCSRRGTISLNWRLVQAPDFVRDYIVLHELAHLKEMNHSRRYWGEVARLCPDFPAAECWLKQHSILLA